MFAAKCSGCGHERELSEAERGREIRCARCGRVEPSGHPDPTAASDSAPDSHNVGTLAGFVSQPVATFTFLSSAITDDELGWLKHYRVIRLLGQGAMGVVFEAVDTKLQRTVALKVMKPDIASDELARQRFEREARATAAVKSDYIVVIHDVDQAENIPYLAMELLQGEPLDKWLARRHGVNLHLAVRIAIEIACGLAAAHEKCLVHRDIKPGNVWLEGAWVRGQESAVGNQGSDSGQLLSTRDSSLATPGRVKILDFGLAHNTQEKANLTQAGLVLGTPAYMAPEQAEGTDVDARSDLFSLGCVLYELTTGQLPFAGPNVMAILRAVALKDPEPPLHLNPELPPALSDLILRLLAKNPIDRPASARGVAELLEGIAAEMGLALQTPTSTISRFQIGVRNSAGPRRRLLVGAVAVAGLLLAGLAAWLVVPLFLHHESVIVLGMSGPFSGPSKELGREMEIGITTALRHVNDQGGVHGSKLRLVALDDRYEPDLALQNMKIFKDEHKVFAVVGNVGASTAVMTVPYAAENKMLFYGAFSGGKPLRENPPNRYVFNYRASYEEEAEAIVKYLVNIKRIPADQIAVFAQQDAIIEDSYRVFVKALRAVGRGPGDVVRVGYPRNPPDANEAVKDAVAEIVKHTEIKAVVTVASYKPAAAFIKQIKDAKRDIIFANVSFVGSEAFAEELGVGSRYIDGVIVTQVVPPVTSRSTAVEKYRDLLKKYYPNERPSFTSLEGYIAATLLIECLKQVSGPPTPEKLIDVFEKLERMDLGTGAVLSFGPSQHQASHKVWGTKLNKAGVFEVLELE